MKTKNAMKTFFAALTLMFFFTGTNLSAQIDSAANHCCMMKKGKMMCMKDGKETAMNEDVTMKNGNKCMANGECITKDGKKMKMKEGQCMDMDGKVKKCNHKGKHDNSKSEAYACPMHSEITSDKPGKCSKCGMDLVKKK